VVLPVCAPHLLGGAASLSPQDIANLPLLQQSTRPDAWRQWFEAQAVAAPLALAGARLELFSMTAAAAVHGLGLALVPKLLVDDELARGTLVVACDVPLVSRRAYYLVSPERDDQPPATRLFLAWLQLATAASDAAPSPSPLLY